MSAPAAFICHSHLDTPYLEQLLEHLALPKRQHGLTIWSSQDIASGAKWREAINAALASATVGILLVSASFLASPFIREQELPILQKAEAGQLRLLSIVWRDCLYQDSLLAKYQPMNTKPLAYLSKPRREEALTSIAAQITAAMLQTEESA